MWIMTTRGFLSGVEHRGDPGRIMVRARVRKDLVEVKELTGSDFKIVKSPRGSDYAYRTTVSREEWAEMCATLAGAVDYDNFKDAVKRRQGKRRAGVYTQVWWALLTLQRQPRKKRRGKKVEPTHTGIERTPDGERGCLRCGIFLLNAERLSSGGDGTCGTTACWVRVSR